MIVVSDTTPLISLLKVGHLDLLYKYFGEVQIPKAVFDELTSNQRFALEAEEIQLNADLATPAVTGNFALLTQKCNRLDEIKNLLDALYAEYETLI